MNNKLVTSCALTFFGVIRALTCWQACFCSAPMSAESWREPRCFYTASPAYYAVTKRALLCDGNTSFNKAPRYCMKDVITAIPFTGSRRKYVKFPDYKRYKKIIGFMIILKACWGSCFCNSISWYLVLLLGFSGFLVVSNLKLILIINYQWKCKGWNNNMFDLIGIIPLCKNENGCCNAYINES